MKKFIIYLAIVMSFLSEELTIEISNIKNSSGNIKIAVFPNKEGFPSEYNSASYLFGFPAKNKKIIETISIPYGDYAISVFHDENNNDKLDTKLFIPKEGVGASNNPKLSFGPPKFGEAKFIFSKENSNIEIKLIYIKQ